MSNTVLFIVNVPALAVSGTVIVVAGLVLAIIVAAASLYLLRNSKKKGKGAATDNAQGWQGAAQQQPGAWNAQPGGNDNAWAQQGQQAWGAQQVQGANGWAQPGAQSQQPAAGSWGTFSNPPPANSWDAQGAAQQPAANNPWGSQQNANSWGAQNAGGQQPAPSPWGATSAGQQGGWNSGQNAPQQPAANNAWGGAAQQQPGSAWNSQPAQSPWDAAPPAQQQAQPWAQGASPSSQSPWDAQGASYAPASQQAPTAYGGSSGPAWNNQAPAAGQAGADPWAQPNAQQPYQGNVPVTPAGSPPAAPSWQQPGYGPGAGWGPADVDKTILRPAPAGAPGSTGQGVVRVEEGKEPGRVYPINKDSLSIGRSRESDIFLEDLAVSRLHASIVNQGNGNYALKDEGSANGTKVNGQLVTKYQTWPLNEGDKIQLGQTVLVFSRN